MHHLSADYAEGYTLTELRGIEDKGQMILAAFRHYAVRGGEALLPQNITAFAWNCGRSSADAKVGLLYARKKRWVVTSSTGLISLTNEGFEEIQLH